MPHQDSEEIFTWIFRTNHWGSNESVSGRGAEMRQTTDVRRALAAVLDRYHVRSVLDAGCGDLNWQRHVPGLLNYVDYVGIDVVAELVERNHRLFEGTRTRFAHLDITRASLPRADLVICRDCLVHLSNVQVLAALERVVESGSRYLLATTYPAETINRDTTDGHWRPINLLASPFCLPEPIEFFDTDFRDNGRNHPGNGLGLWLVEGIPTSDADDDRRGAADAR